jgi:UDP-galactopyranose mutase
MTDFIIIGAGLAGIVMAERIANVLGREVLIIEKRDHIGGNCYDFYDDKGILIHKYGPHIFHTDFDEVWTYLSQFTEWNDYQHRVLGYIDGYNVPIPFNLGSLHQLLPEDLAGKLESKLIKTFGYDVRIPILELRKLEDPELKYLADFIYDKVFLNYTKKQWGVEPEELDPSVTARVPVYISKDDRYFQNKYQGLPRNGYTQMFENMLSSENIQIKLSTNSKEVIKRDGDKFLIFDEEFKGKLIYTCKIDELFNYGFGELPYRSLDFEFENLNQEYYQEIGTVNYPNDYNFTRITEFKHLTGQKAESTTIAHEYPRKYVKETNIPYYPIPKKENRDIYYKYKMKGDELDNLILIGRLAEYQYYDMDEIVAEALKTFEEKIR